jgi:hypothetical protein
VIDVNSVDVVGTVVDGPFRRHFHLMISDKQGEREIPK